ncbi:hypothetical protein EBR66_06250 [bacterium]|nr:hypothetical protein [bacterium]
MGHAYPISFALLLVPFAFALSPAGGLVSTFCILLLWCILTAENRNWKRMARVGAVVVPLIFFLLVNDQPLMYLWHRFFGDGGEYDTILGILSVVFAVSLPGFLSSTHVRAFSRIVVIASMLGFILTIGLFTQATTSGHVISSSDSRFVVFRSMSEHLFGIAPNSFPREWERFAPSTWSTSSAWRTLPENPRSYVEGIALVLGLPLFLVLVIWYIATLLLWWKQGERTVETRALALMCLITPGVLLFMIPPLFFLVYAGAALGVLRRHSVEDHSVSPPFVTRLALLVWGGALLLSCILFARIVCTLLLAWSLAHEDPEGRMRTLSAIVAVSPSRQGMVERINAYNDVLMSRMPFDIGKAETIRILDSLQSSSEALTQFVPEVRVRQYRAAVLTMRSMSDSPKIGLSGMHEIQDAMNLSPHDAVFPCFGARLAWFSKASTSYEIFSEYCSSVQPSFAVASSGAEILFGRW